MRDELSAQFVSGGGRPGPRPLRYGTFAYAVARRRVEVGIRLTLGASRGDVFRLFLGEAAVLVVVGLVAGTGAALAGSRYVQSLLSGISPRDPASVFWAVGCMFAAAAIATYPPAHRAARVQPSAALRDE